MLFKNLTEERFSVRNYKTIEVEKDKINYIFECVRTAPSATNNQPWHFYVITLDSDKIEVQKAYDREWFKKAPLYIIACGDHQKSWTRSNYDNKKYTDIDLAIACEHLCLAATEQGLGSCWVCNFDPQIISNFLKLPSYVEPIAIFPIGYLDDNFSKPEKKRKELDEFITWR